MRFGSRTAIKLAWAAYLLLTSIYCLLAYLPYTYYAVIKAPPYEWMPWFVAHHAHIYCALLACTAIVWTRRTQVYFFIFFGSCALAGLVLLFHPLLPGLQCNSADYTWSLIALFPLTIVSTSEIIAVRPKVDASYQSSLTYLPMVLAAIAISLITLLGTKIKFYRQGRPVGIHLKNFELGLWTVVTHVVLALIVVSAANLIFALAAKTARPRVVGFVTIVIAVGTAFTIGLKNFLNTAFSFEGWRSMLYAVVMASALISVVCSVLLAWRSAPYAGTAKASNKFGMAAALVVLLASALVLPSTVSEWDWNSVIQRAFTLLLWLALAAVLHRLLHRPQIYSIPAVLAVLLISTCSYKALQWTAFLWSKPLGPTNEDVLASIENYSLQNVSLQLAHHALGNAPETEKCGDLCRIMRQYTNIRNAQTTTEVKLVDSLVPSAGEHPNIFIFVIDSMRPDYLGAYNPKVNFTPHIDSLARDSIVFRNAYTQYAGTTLSEPAIWSGAMLLHAHYLRPFENVNSLEKLAKTDGYKMVISFDSVLKELLSPSDQLVKLDTGKPWNEFEMCSTVQQLDASLDARSDKASPVFFYAQPMNVHMFARNQQPLAQNIGWRRSGFSPRISNEVHEVDQCMGEFVTGLKARGMYDNSIIILASDHGDATGEFGRQTHSSIIYPEVMHVPLIVHLPKSMQGKFMDNRDGISTLTDIAPTLYYLLGHQPIHANPMYGHPLFAKTKAELARHDRHEVFFASDEVAVYGLLEQNGRYLYATYDSPARSFLFDLEHDPNAEHSVLTAEEKKHYDEKIIDYLKMIADFYGYKPQVGTLLSARKR